MEGTSSMIAGATPRPNLAVEALHEAWKSNSWPGASTATLAVVTDTELDVASMGDCKLLVLRDGDLIFETTPKWHAFNMPQQLGSESPDQPLKSETKRIQVQEGDVIVIASDGLFDNIFLEHIVEEASSVRPVQAHLPNAPRLVSLEPGLHESVAVRQTATAAIRLREGYDAFAAEANETIGRNASNTCQVLARGVSGIHCAIYYAGEEGNRQLYVEDRGSTNGCFVNENRISEMTQLQHGDVLTLARPTVEQARAAGLPAYEVDLFWERREVSPEELAERLALAAYQASLDPTAQTPFNDAAQAAGYPRTGGKVDDITVVAAVVVGEEGSATTRSFKAVLPSQCYEEPGLAGSNNPEHIV